MTPTRVLTVAAACLTLLTAGCAPDAGTVTSTTRTFNAQTKSWAYEVCVRDADGKTGCESVMLDDYLSCPKGAAWPDCREG